MTIGWDKPNLFRVGNNLFIYQRGEEDKKTTGTSISQLFQLKEK